MKCSFCKDEWSICTECNNFKVPIKTKRQFSLHKNTYHKTKLDKSVNDQVVKRKSKFEEMEHDKKKMKNILSHVAKKRKIIRESYSDGHNIVCPQSTMNESFINVEDTIDDMKKAAVRYKAPVTYNELDGKLHYVVDEFVDRQHRLNRYDYRFLLLISLIHSIYSMVIYYMI